MVGMTRRYPIGYVRRSSADATSPGDVSREAQETAVHELARRDGYNGETVILTDWDKSADPEKESRRTGYLAMLAAIERGEVSAVYAASLDRLYRSMRTFVRLTDAAKVHDVRIVTLREGVLGGDGSPMAQAFAEITAVFSSLELRTAQARAAGGLAVRRERGDHIGMTGYGWRLARTPDGKLARSVTGGNVLELDPDRPLGPILDAMREARGGTRHPVTGERISGILGACKLLQARGIPTRDGRTVWRSTTLRRIIEANAPELVPPPGASGRRQPSNAMLAQLLRCPCGAILTPEAAGKWRKPGYRCARGNRLGRGTHGPVYVTEAAVLPFVQAETEALRRRLPTEYQTAGEDRKREALDAKRARVVDAFMDGTIDKADRDRRLVAVDAALEAIEDVARIVAVPPIDWAWTAADINAILRAMFREIRLGPDLLPVVAEPRPEGLRA